MYRCSQAGEEDEDEEDEGDEGEEQQENEEDEEVEEVPSKISGTIHAFAFPKRRNKHMKMHHHFEPIVTNSINSQRYLISENTAAWVLPSCLLSQVESKKARLTAFKDGVLLAMPVGFSNWRHFGMGNWFILSLLIIFTGPKKPQPLRSWTWPPRPVWPVKRTRRPCVCCLRNI